jgi:hypothetical protein
MVVMVRYWCSQLSKEQQVNSTLKTVVIAAAVVIAFRMVPQLSKVGA